MNLIAAADKRIDLAEQRLLVQVDGIGLQGAAGGGVAALILFTAGRQVIAFVGPGYFGDAVGQVIDDVQAGDALFVKAIDGLGFALAENGDKDVRAADLLLPR